MALNNIESICTRTYGRYIYTIYR